MHCTVYVYMMQPLPFSCTHSKIKSHMNCSALRRCVKVLPVFFILRSTILEYFTVPTPVEVFSLPSPWFCIRSPWHFCSLMPTSAKLYNRSIWWTTVYTLLLFVHLCPPLHCCTHRAPPTFCRSCNGVPPQIHPIFFLYICVYSI